MLDLQEAVQSTLSYQMVTYDVPASGRKPAASELGFVGSLRFWSKDHEPNDAAEKFLAADEAAREVAREQERLRVAALRARRDEVEPVVKKVQVRRRQDVFGDPVPEDFIKNLHRRGMSAREIERRSGVGRNRISRILAGKTLVKTKENSENLELQLLAILADMPELTLTGIADELNRRFGRKVHFSWVQKVLKRMGIK